MKNFILRFEGRTPPDAKDIDRILAVKDLTLLDQSPKMLLVKGLEGPLKEVIQTLPDWSMTKEIYVPLPPTRPSLRNKA